MNYELIAPRNESLSNFEQVLFNRGIKDIYHFEHPTEKDILDPLLLDNMNEGAKILISHVQQNDKIFFQVDSDCDGYTSSAILINYLNCLFPHFAQTKISYRVHGDKTHGVISETIPEDIKLVIAPDCTSSSFEDYKKLHDRGIDVLLLDHHEADRVSTDACVINNQLCNYPTKALSGAGIVYKFCCYLDSLLGSDYANDYLDLTTLGIIADVMSLASYEVRAIILKGMQNFRNPLLKAMIEKDNFHFGGRDLTPFNISWYIAPMINAITRTGTVEEKQIVFESMIEFLSYKTVPSTKRGCRGQFETRVEQAVRTCSNVKNRQGKARDNAALAVDEIIKSQDLAKNKVLIIKLDPKYAVDKNLTGLIANGIMSSYQRPTLILNKTIDKETKKINWEGSGRGYDKSNLGSFRDALEKSGLVNWAQGQ